MSKYPTKIDSDAELPRVEDNLSENSVETINALREAIIAIEKAIGVNPQGSTATLVQRLSVFFNDDGTAKASALVAAGLVALPVTNAMIAANAGIKEDKLDLEIATKTLQCQISSNDTDIEALRDTITASLAAYANHVNGIAQKHDGYAILLDKLYPTSTPPWFVNLTATDVSTALAAINNRFVDHASASKVGAHPASSISVDASTLQNVTALNVQGALEQLDETRAVELVDHRDDMHANGLSLWANSTDGYNERNQIVPTTLGATATAFIPSGTTNIIDFTPLSLATFSAKQGDVLAIFDTVSIGTYVINDIGPRNVVGTKPSLTAAQLEIVGLFPSDGYVSTRIYGSSSTILLKGNLASTIHQHDAKVDSLQVSRPNAARVVTLGVNPKFIDSTHTLALEVGVSALLSRSIVISDLNKDRNGVVVNPPTIDSMVERINYVFQNSADGNAFPVAAYRVGDEIMLSHNWTDDFAYIKVTSAGNANFYLGFDDIGSNIVDRYVYPTANAYYYVNGKKLHDVAKITQRTGTASGQYIGFTGFNPIAAGIKIGHLVQVKNHATLNENGTYFITEVTTSAIKVHKAAGLTAQASLEIEIWHDALPLDDFNTNVKDTIIESFITSDGTIGYNERLNYEDLISNLAIVDVSDNFLESNYTLNSTVSGGVATLKFTGPYEKLVTIPTTFSGRVKVPSPHQIEYITVDVTAPIGSGSSICQFYDHINEEEVLELCSVRLNGLLTLSDIVDRRMFGTLGLDELREDVVHAYIETPAKELRSNGVISGLDIIDGYYQDPNFPLSANVYGVLIRGGAAMVDGTRVETSTTSLMFPNIAGTYFIGLNKLGSVQLLDSTQYSMAELLDGYADELALIAQVDHDGAGPIPASIIDLRYNISKIDDRIDLLFDESNHFIGQFSSFASALQYVNNYPKNEKFKIRVVSHGGGDLDIASVNHNLTVVIDGQVNDVSVNGPCKITSDSLGFRTAPHIRGSLTINTGSNNVEVSNISIANGSGASTLTVNTGGVYKFTNVTFDGSDSLGQLYVTSPGATSSVQIVLDSCKFKPGTAINVSSGSVIVNSFIINNCEIYGIGSGSKVSATSNNLVVNNTLLDNCGISNASVLTNPITINNCVFKNMTVVSGGNYVINTASPMLVSNTKFISISASTQDAIISTTGLDVNTQIYFDHCFFQSCSASVGFKLIESAGVVSNSVFKSITCPIAPGGLLVECTEFNNNTILGTTNEFAVGASNIRNNNNLVAVTGASFASLQRVAGNTFLGSTVLGYNVRSTASGLEILNNVFTTGSQVAIDVAASTSEIIVSQNEFLHTGTCLNFATLPAETIIDSNIIKCATLVSGPGTGEGALIFSDNIFELAGTFTVSGVLNNVIFDSNIFRAGTLSVDSSAVAGLMINDNIFNDGLIINADIDGGNVSNNAFSDGSITFNGNMSDMIILNNVDVNDIDVTFGAISVTRTIISNNIFNFVSISSAVLSNTVINGNIINSTTVTLNIDPSTSSTDYAHVVFSENILDSSADIILTSTGAIRGVTIDGNIAPSATGAPFIRADVVINECVITENFNFEIEITSGANSCNISDNIALNEDLILNGAFNSNIISGNYLRNLTFTGTSASGILLANMFINGTTSISATAGNVDKLAFINNVTTGMLTVASSGGNFTRLSVSGNTVGSSTLLNMSGSDISIVGNIFLNTVILWSVTGNYTLSNTNISNNICSIDMMICNVVTSGSTASFTDSKVSGNVVTGNIYIMTGVVTGATMTFNNNIISDNSCNDINVFGTAVVRGTISFSRNSFNNNRLVGDIIFASGSGAPTSNTDVDRVLISGNSLNAFSLGRWFTYDSLSIVSNRFNDSTASITFDIDPVAASGTYDNLIISDNVILADITVDIRSGTGPGPSMLISRLMMTNNIMPNADFITRFHSSSTNLINATLVSWVIQGNIMRAIAIDGSSLSANVASSLGISYCNIANNGFGGDTAAFAGTTYEPGIYVSKGSKTGASTISLLSIVNNFANPSDTTSFPRTQIFIDNTAGATSWSISNLDISLNKGIDIVIDDDATMAFSQLSIRGNVFKNTSFGTERGLRRIGPSTTSSTISEFAFEGNIGGQLDVGGINTLNYALVSNNSLPSGLDILLDTISNINSLIVSNNISTGTSNLNINEFTSAQSVVISGNRLSIFNISSGSRTLTRLALNNNYFSGLVTISSTAKPLASLIDCTINSNIFGASGILIQNVSSSIDSLTITGNQCDGTIDFGDTVNIDDLVCVGNRIETLDIRDVTTHISDAIINSNVFSNLYIPPDTVWTNGGAGPGRSVIIGNRISTNMDSKAPGFNFATVTSRCFVFGNTSGFAAVNINTTGANTARTISNSTVLGGGITP